MVSGDCRVDFEDGLPATVFWRNVEIGGGWGIETADCRSFFTFAPSRRGCRITADRSWKEGTRHCRDSEVRMAEGLWRLVQETDVEDHRILRRQRLICIDDCILQDFVCRFCFRAANFGIGHIAHLSLPHRKTNRWYQFPVTSAKLEGTSMRVEVRTISWEGAGKFKLETYLRDQPNGEWIIHARLMPSGEDLLWVHWRTRFGNLLDLRGKAARILLSILPLRRALWHLSERRGGRPQLTAQALALLAKGTEISIEAECRFQPKSQRDATAD